MSALTSIAFTVDGMRGAGIGRVAIHHASIGDLTESNQTGDEKGADSQAIGGRLHSEAIRRGVSVVKVADEER